MRTPSFGTMGMAVSSVLILLASATASAFGATFSIGGTLSGLKSGDTVVLLDNKKNALSLKANGNFAFTTELATGAAYDVTVGTQPKDQVCAIAGASGTVGTKSVTGVKVTCVDTFSIGGTISGLDLKEKLILLDNGGDALTIDNLSGGSKPLSFTFKTPVATGAKYAVTIGTPPLDEVCTVTKGTGTVKAANVTAVAVTCAHGYTVGGTVSGLVKGRSLTLLDNGVTR